MEQRDAGIDAAFTSTVNKAIDARCGIDEVGARLAEIVRRSRSSS